MISTTGVQTPESRHDSPGERRFRNVGKTAAGDYPRLTP